MRGERAKVPLETTALNAVNFPSSRESSSVPNCRRERRGRPQLRGGGREKETPGLFFHSNSKPSLVPPSLPLLDVVYTEEYILS